MWDLPRPGLEPVSPALAGGFSTTAPPGKPTLHILKHLAGLPSGRVPPPSKAVFSLDVPFPGLAGYFQSNGQKLKTISTLLFACPFLLKAEFLYICVCVCIKSVGVIRAVSMDRRELEELFS